MKNRTTLLVCALLFLAYNGNSQVIFEKGYVIDESGQRIECEIKNSDWKNNPTKFNYRLSANDEAKTGSVESVKEFGIGKWIKYVRHTTKIDKSKITLRDLSSSRNPEYLESTTFMKVLLDGSISLLSYEESNVKQFYISKPDFSIEPLVYKRYLNQNSTVSENTSFRQQLLNALISCKEIGVKNIESISYTEESLLKLLKVYHECIQANYSIYEREKSKNILSLSIRPGLSFDKLSIKNDLSSFDDAEFKTTVSPRLGLELEIVLPYNKNKWSFIFEPTYRQFKSDKTISESSGAFITKINYHSIEFPIGIRHYFFLPNNSKIFLNMIAVKDFDLKSTIEFERPALNYKNSIDISTSLNFGAGIGYKVKKINAEFRYLSKREILTTYTYWTSNYNSMSVIVGYTLNSKKSP